MKTVVSFTLTLPLLFILPTQGGGTDVDSEAGQCGWLGVVWEQQGLEAEPLLHTGQDTHTGDTDAVAQLQLLLGTGHLIHQTGLLGLVPDTIDTH